MKALFKVAALLAISPVVFAGQPVDESVSVENADALRVIIEHMNGEADIQGWDKDEVKVTGEISDRAEEFIFERRGNEVIIKVEMPGGINWGWDNNDDGDDLRIWVPRQSRVDYESINARVTVVNIAGDVDVDTVNGNMDARELSGRVRLDSVNGNIDAERISGEIDIETVNGDIRERSNTASEIHYTIVNGDLDLETSARRVKVESVNGDVELRLQEIESLTIDTVGGDVEASMQLSSRARVEGTTVNGDISLRFPADVDASFSMQGHAGGDLRNKLTDAKMEKAKYGPGRWLDFTTGSGSARVELSTVNGRLEVDKR